MSGKTILIIAPHPDDDIIGCGGALAILSGHHNRVIAADWRARGHAQDSKEVGKLARHRLVAGALKGLSIGQTLCCVAMRVHGAQTAKRIRFNALWTYTR
jgi:hypothetical protein